MWQDEGLHLGLRAGIHQVYLDDSECPESLPIPHRVIAIDRVKSLDKDESLQSKACLTESLAALDRTLDQDRSKKSQHP